MQVAETLPHGRQGLTYLTWPISWQLMTWRRKEPGHQLPWYWASYHRMLQFQHHSRVNSLWSVNDHKWHLKSWSSLDQVIMARCLIRAVPGHYLKQIHCWIIISWTHRSNEHVQVNYKLMFFMHPCLHALTRWGLVTPYSDRDLGQHWLR